MQKNRDIFEKLNNHRLPIDESYWAEMEERLQKKRKQAVPFWLWITGTGIAASLALLVTLRVFNVDVSTQMTQIERIPADEIEFKKSGSFTFNENEETTNNQQVFGTQKMQIAQNSANNATIKNSKQKNPHQSVSSAFKESTQIEQISADDTIISQQDQNLRESIQSASSACSKPDTIPEKQAELKLNYDDWFLAQIEPEFELKKEKKQPKKSWEIAAAFSSSASNSSNSDLGLLAENDKGDYAVVEDGNRPSLVIPPYFGPNGDPVISNENPSIDDIHGEFPKVTHLPPLSVGLTVRKNFNQYLAIETGLTYSFLQSKFEENRDWIHRDATLKLHYLGIPLNAVVYLLNKPKWNVYFSLGGMMEKGIMMDYVQHTTYKYYWWQENETVYTVSLEEEISGLQWSLNTSFGIGCKIYRGIGIYFEPRIIYYFKNNQPVSVRTETPLQVGLNAGLRFEF